MGGDSKITKEYLVEKSEQLLNDFIEFRNLKIDPIVDISYRDDYLLGEMKKNLIDFTFNLQEYDKAEL